MMEKVQQKIEKEQKVIDDHMKQQCRAVLDLRDKVESIIESSSK
jgi:lipid II:glycine glycyltransferase (peptidoglycan interpeptide bridge formation enzyme)